MSWFIKTLSLTAFLLGSCFCLKASISPEFRTLNDSLRKEAIARPKVLDKVIDSLIAAAFSEKDSFRYGKLIDIKGLVKRQLGEYAEALKAHHQAYDIFNIMGEKAAAVSSLNGLGAILISTGQYEEASEYFMQALQLIDKKDTVMMKVLYTNLGVTYDYSDKTLEAIEMYKKAATFTSPDDYFSMGVNYHNIGVCYSMLKEYKKAIEYELIALEYQDKHGSVDQLARVCISLGGEYLDIGNISKARHYLKIGGEAAFKINSVELEEAYYEHMVDLYTTTKETRKALEAYQKLTELKSTIYNEESAKNIAEAETKFKVSIKDKEIENLKINQKLADLQKERDHLVRNVLVLIILLGATIIFVMFHNYKLRKKNFRLIEKEKMALEKSNEYLNNENILARFEILKSQISPHFLFNTLNALSFLIESDTEKAVQFTNAFSKLFRVVLELKDKNLIPLKDELKHVESYFFLQHIRFNENLKISQQIDPEYLELKLPPFSIQMAVENALNHNSVTSAEPLYLNISCSGNYLVIENNLQPKATAVKSTSIGISNIKTRYSYFTDISPEFTKTADSFVVKLPLLEDV